MITLKNKDTGQYISSITEVELQYLIDELEEEHSEDRDYWLNRTQLQIMKDKGAEISFIEMLESALGENDEMEVVWERT